MKYKFLQLNIQKGKYIKSIIDYIKTYNFDILNFQEVAGGQARLCNLDCFDLLKSSLNLKGEQAACWFLRHNPETYLGNATFYKPSFKKRLKLLDKQVVWLKPHPEIERDKVRLQDLPKNALCTKFQIGDIVLSVVNCHLAWGPNPKDRKFKLEQGKKLYNLVKDLKPPFILSGDFNVTPSSQIVAWIEKLANNLTTRYSIQNTLNPNTHRSKQLFPKGLAVDFIFTSKDINVTHFKLVDKPDLSDHFGLMCEFEL